MKLDCPICGAPMIWGGDHDGEDDSGDEFIVSNLHCSECLTEAEIYQYEDKKKPRRSGDNGIKKGCGIFRQLRPKDRGKILELEFLTDLDNVCGCFHPNALGANLSDS